MSNENQKDPPDERKAWTEPRLMRLGVDLQDVEAVKSFDPDSDGLDHDPLPAS